LGDAGTITADTGEEFAREGDAACAPVENGIENLQPRGLQVGCLIFDMPADVDPESVDVRFGKAAYEPATVDLTRSLPEGVGPDETLGLWYEYSNVRYLDLAYEMYAPESQEQIPYDAFVQISQRDAERWPISSYAFPEVNIEGDHATVERVLTAYDTRNYEVTTTERTQEFVRIDDSWRIIARPESVNYFNDPEALPS
jgi:hypothetical protein